MIARDCLLARETGGWLHLCHVSTGVGIATVEWARSLGARVTAEVMPHHLVMSDKWVAGSRTLHNTVEEPGGDAMPMHPDTKVNPPLRTSEDTVALLAALKQGQFDILATDHAPHAAAEKVDSDYVSAAFGMSGLELAVPTLLALVRAGHLSMFDLVCRLSTRPAELFKLPVGRLEVGGRADLTLIDPAACWTVDSATLVTRSKNTPLMGIMMTGRAVLTMVKGEVVHDRC
jgi:dihydroorotase